jgi:hypothetical protein
VQRACIADDGGGLSLLAVQISSFVFGSQSARGVCAWEFVARFINYVPYNLRALLFLVSLFLISPCSGKAVEAQ